MAKKKAAKKAAKKTASKKKKSWCLAAGCVARSGSTPRAPKGLNDYQKHSHMTCGDITFRRKRNIHGRV